MRAVATLPLLVLLLLMCNEGRAQWVQQGPIVYDTAAVGAIGAGTCSRISADGSTLAVTVPYHKGQRGAFAVFTNSGGNWVQQAFIEGCDTTRLGGYLALSANGNTLAVTTALPIGWPIPKHDTLMVYTRSNNIWQLQYVTGIGNNGMKVALSADGNTLLCDRKIWVRNNNQWMVQDSLIPNDATSNLPVDYQKSGVALSADGNTAVIGNYNDNGGVGATWIFARNGTNWIQQGAKLVGVGFVGATPKQGEVVALAGDGNRLVVPVGSDNGVSNAVVFRRNGNTWAQEDTLLFSITNSPQYDCAINYNGSVIVCAQAWAAGWQTFERVGLEWNLVNYNYANSAINISNASVSLDSTGGILAVGQGMMNGRTGATYLFSRAGNVWQQNNVVNPVGGKGKAAQGHAVAFSKDGSTLAVSALGENGNECGAVSVYIWNGTDWVKQGPTLRPPSLGTFEAYFYGNEIGISDDGNTLVVGASTSRNMVTISPAKVYVYRRHGGSWAISDSLVYAMPNKTYFGRSLSLSGDGNVILCSGEKTLMGQGGYGQKVYVYRYNGASWLQEAVLDSMEHQGFAIVRLSGDGNTAVVSMVDSGSRGGVNVYTYSNGVWAKQATGLCPAGINNPYFPTNIAVSNNGNSILLHGGSLNDGRVWVFSKQGVVWNFDTTLYSLGGYVSYGMDMSLSGDTIVVATQYQPGFEYVATDYKVAAVYKKSFGIWGLDSYLSYPDWRRSYYANAVSVSANNLVAIGSSNSNNVNGSVIVFRNTGFAVTLTVNDSATCPQSNNGGLTISIGGGTQPYNITWSNGVTGLTNLTGLAQGSYSVTVTDADGMALVRTYTVVAKSNMHITTMQTNINCQTQTGSAKVVVTGGQVPYTYAWNTTPPQNTDSVYGIGTGTYIVTITDSRGCVLADTVTVNANSYWTSTSAVQPNCQNNGIASVSLYGGVPPFTYLWNSGSTADTAAGLGAGVYTVTITDGNNCTNTGSITLYNYCNGILTGQAYYDANQNCQWDSGEVAAPNYNIIAANGGVEVYGNTGVNGNYQVQIPTTGSYNVSVYKADTCDLSLCPTLPMPVNFGGVNDTVWLNLPLVSMLTDLTLQANIVAANPGFTNRIRVYYGSQTNIPAATGTIALHYDSWLTYSSATPQPASVDIQNRIITWNVTNVLPIRDLTQFVEASFVVSPYAPVPSTIYCEAKIITSETECDTANNNIPIRIPVVGSYDPNSKVVYPDSVIMVGDSILEYTIHFQNLGTDTTHFIVIKDTLSAYLNPASVYTIATSHLPYTFTLSEGGILTWRFEPIALVDSATDEANSHGFVTYRVKVKPGLSIGTVINNTAHIYFDYNEAVVTNTASNTVTSPVIIGLNHLSTFGSLQLYPNPANNLLTVQCSSAMQQLSVYDVTGRVVIQHTTGNVQHIINVTQLAGGAYFVKATTANATYSARFVKQ